MLILSKVNEYMMQLQQELAIPLDESGDVGNGGLMVKRLTSDIPSQDRSGYMQETGIGFNFPGLITVMRSS